MTDKKVTILGSTGSVGTQTVEVCHNLGARVSVLASGRDYKKMETQARLLKPRLCVMEDEAAAKELALLLADTDIEVDCGEDAVLRAAADEDSDIIFNSIGGSAGLRPTLASLRMGRTVALSNKESIVMAGDEVMRCAAEHGGRIIPVDSEHSAIFQCLEGRGGCEIGRILLTASGGPFFGMSLSEQVGITTERALAHPTWNMGAKITIDSATLMNKGFEVIEAVHLFDVLPEQVKVVIHRESIIHSMVEYTDNAIMAQMSLPDMRLCAQYALTYPKRVPGLMGQLNLAAVGTLSFYEPDYDNFPLLGAAYDCIKAGGMMPAALVAADEGAVDAFLKKKIGFTDIYKIVHDTLSRFAGIPAGALADVYEAAAEARRIADGLTGA